MPVTDVHTLAVTGLSDELHVLEFQGREGTSQLYEIDVVIASPSMSIAFDDVIRKKATLTFATWDDSGDGQKRSGIVSRFEHVDSSKNTASYRITLVPWAWKLEHRADNRIFQNMTVGDIVKKVLTGAGATEGDDFKVSLSGTYVQREYCVQYRESDWSFVCRLLEEEGIFYYFDHSGDSERLVIADGTSAYPPVPGSATLVFAPPFGAIGSAARDTRVTAFRSAEEIRPGKVTVNDWDFIKPSLKLIGEDEGKQDASLEIYDQPANYTVPADGTTAAAVRLGELNADRATGAGESLCTRLGAGYTFELSDHPRDAFNVSYVVTHLEYSGHDPKFHHDREDGEAPGGDSLFHARFQVVAATVLVRPPRVTRRPHIHGVQTAIVVGPSGEEIYTDEHGRVKVQFHWDRLGKSDDKSSCWIRVSQPWASAAFGAIFLPRIGDEVVVTFLEGNPDRPLIVGSVYHGTNVPPYALPDNKTKSTIKSNTSKGGGGSNELRFEDKKGSEEVYLHAQKDWNTVVENDRTLTIKHDETIEVDNDRTKTVKHDQTGTIQHDDSLTVQHDQTLTVQNDRNVTVQNDHTETVQGTQSVTITKEQTVTLNDKQTISVAKQHSLTVTGDATQTFKAKHTLEVDGDVSHTLKAKRTLDVKGDDAHTVGGDRKVDVSGKQTVTITGDSVENVTGKKTMSVTGAVTITSGASTVKIEPSGQITIQGVQVKVDASGPLELHGAMVTLKADAMLTIQAPLINSNADGVNTVKGAMIMLDGQAVSAGS